MNLLEKFTAVEVKADGRISENDKDYCERHQKAYETAISNYRELTSREGPEISQRSIERHIESLHEAFITTLIRYFNQTYHVSIDPSEVQGALLPKQPAGRWRGNDQEIEKRYHEQMQSLSLRYQDVVDQIILRLDGRSFAEQAFYELRGKCQRAAWNSCEQKARFERKKDTIRFIGYFCRFRGWPYDGWELGDSMKEILCGLAHYETGVYNIFPVGFSCATGYRELKEDVVEFPTCEKVKQMKLFKDNRVDIKFASPECAEEFITQYLGTVCEVA